MTAERRIRDLLEAYRDHVYTMSCYYLGDNPDAEDVTQEVLFRLWQNRNGLEVKALPVWVARNACIDVLRKRRRERERLVPEEFEAAATQMNRQVDHPGNPRSALELTDLRQCLIQAIQRIEEPYRGIILLREIQEMSYGEISQALDLPLNTVKVYLYRARRMLREMVRARIANGQL